MLKIERGAPGRGLKVVRAFTNLGGGGGRFVETNFQLLMLSSNLLKSKIPMLRVGGPRGIYMLSSNLLKSKIPMLRVGGGGLVEF